MHPMQEGAHAGGLSLRAFGAAVRGAAVIFILDRVTKTVLQSAPVDWSGLPGNIITSVYHKNYGIIANFPLPLAVTVTVTIFVILLVLGATWTAIKEGSARQAAALGVLLGGALGNLFDRLAQGYVFDWILLFERSAINLADIAIVLGAVWYFTERRRDESRELCEARPATPEEINRQ